MATHLTLDPDGSAPWFHGSPYELVELREGSTITQDRALARVFSHQPTLVVDDNGTLSHNGRREGFLYRIADSVRRGDLRPVPGSTMAPGKEWLIARPLRVVIVERTAPIPEEQLSAEEEAALRRRIGRGGPVPTPTEEAG